MPTLASRFALSLLGLTLAASSQAATVTGTITSTLSLTGSCLVNGASGNTNLNFGTLNFGTQTSLFTQAPSQVLGPNGSALAIQCSAGVAPIVTIQAGAHDGAATGGSRALADGAGNFVPYDSTPTPDSAAWCPIPG